MASSLQQQQQHFILAIIKNRASLAMLAPAANPGGVAIGAATHCIDETDSVIGPHFPALHLPVFWSGSRRRI